MPRKTLILVIFLAVLVTVLSFSVAVQKKKLSTAGKEALSHVNSTIIYPVRKLAHSVTSKLHRKTQRNQDKTSVDRDVPPMKHMHSDQEYMEPIKHEHLKKKHKVLQPVESKRQLVEHLSPEVEEALHEQIIIEEAHCEGHVCPGHHRQTEEVDQPKKNLGENVPHEYY
ncbi:hypothetical protein RCL1_003896 [Eukaryota sp. TZLM3-RCL]